VADEWRPEYCFGVRPGARFVVNDKYARFFVQNDSGVLLRVTVDVLCRESTAGAAPATRGESFQSTSNHTQEFCRAATSAESERSSEEGLRFPRSGWMGG